MQGMTETVMPAWSMPQSVPPRLVCWREAERMRGRVKLESVFMMTRAARNSFQEVMKAKSATVMVAGAEGHEQEEGGGEEGLGGDDEAEEEEEEEGLLGGQGEAGERVAGGDG